MPTISFESYLLEAYVEASIASIGRLSSLVNPSEASSDPLLEGSRPELKALIYVSMHAAVEGALKLACRLVGEAFVSIHPPCDKEPTTAFYWLAGAAQYAQALRQSTNNQNLEFNSASLFLNHLDDTELRVLVENSLTTSTTQSSLWSAVKDQRSRDYDPGFSGFFRYSTLEAYLKFLGMSLGNLERNAQLVNFEQEWESLRAVRNSVAHGRADLRQLGRDISDSELKRHLEIWEVFIKAFKDELVVKAVKLPYYYR